MTTYARLIATTALVLTAVFSTSITSAQSSQVDVEENSPDGTEVDVEESSPDGTEVDAEENSPDGTEVDVGENSPDDAKVDVLENMKAKIEERLSGINITSVQETPVAGLYELVSDGQIYYVNEEADYLIDGSIIQLSDRTNLTDARLGGIHMSLIEGVGDENMLIYTPEGETSRTITVFTDISCGYCRKLHAELDTLLEEGVSVRYLLFPRAGLGSQGHKDLESVWCAENPQEAMTNAKAGGVIEPLTCDNPIELHVALAERVGLRGTPLIYTDSGEKIPGYRQASELATLVNNTEPMEF